MLDGVNFVKCQVNQNMSNIDHKKNPLQTQFLEITFGFSDTADNIRKYLKSGHKVISMTTMGDSCFTVLEPPVIKEDEQK